MSDAQIKVLTDYVSLLNRNALAHVIRVASRLGIFEALREGQKSNDELAEHLELDKDALAQFMDVLQRTELVDQYREDFALSPVGKLIPHEMMALGDDFWFRMETYIRTGKSLPVDESTADTDGDFLQTAAAQEWMCTPAALDTAEALGVGDKRQKLNVLELGCSTGVFGLTILHTDPESSATFVDDASGLARAKETVISLGFEERIQLVESDYLQIGNLELEPFDLVLVTSVLHRHSLDECLGLINGAVKMLKPGGELAIVDIFPGQEEGDLYRSISALQICLRTTKGRLHSPDDIRSLLTESGLNDVQFAHLPSEPKIWGLVVAKKN